MQYELCNRSTKVSTMGNSNLIPVGGGGDTDRFPGVGTHQVSDTNKQRLADVLRRYQVYTGGELPQDAARQDLLAQIVADEPLAQADPGLSRLIDQARAGLVDCIYVTNLPTEKPLTSLLSLVLSSALGKSFNYASENGDKLIMEATSDLSAAENARAELDWHTEGAWIPRELRAEWIGLLGLDDVPGIYTAYAPIKPVVQTLSARTREWLYSQSACFRAPLSLGLGANAWSGPRAILSQSPRGEIEIAWASYAIRAARPDDKVYVQALTELYSEINRQHVRMAIDAGCLMAFNNLRGVHMHSPGDDGDRLLYKTYACQSLRRLKQMTGEGGPIFDLRKALTLTPKAHRLPAPPPQHR
jgi:hypothetical protein